MNMNIIFVKDIVKYIPSKLLPGLFAVFIIPVFTTLFEPDEYGQYVIVMSSISVLSIIAIDWISTSIVRFYAEYEKKSQLKQFNGTIVKLAGISVGCVLVICSILMYFFKSNLNPNLYYYLNIGLLLFIFGSAFNLMLSLLVVKRKPSLYSLAYIWRQCACIIIGLGIVNFCTLGVDGLLWGIFFGILVIIPIMFRSVFKEFTLKPYSKELSVNITRYGFPLVATNLSAWIISLSDRYIIEYFRGSQEVGLYSISYSLADHSIQLLVSLIILASAPIVMKIWETQGPYKTGIFVHDLTKFYLIIVLPSAVGLSLISKPLIQLLATQNYYEGYRIIPLVALSIFIFGLQRNFQLSLLFHKKTKLIMYIVLISGLINISLNIIFVPKYGFEAAGYSTMFSYIIFGILIVYISRKYFIWPFPYKSLIKVLTAVAVMSVVVLGVQQLEFIKAVWMKIAFSVLSGAIVYFVLLIFMNELDKIKIYQFLSLFKKK